MRMPSSAIAGSVAWACTYVSLMMVEPNSIASSAATRARRDRFILAHIVRMRDARRVGRCKAHVLGHAARHRQHGMGVDVHKARRREMTARVDGPARR